MQDLSAYRAVSPLGQRKKIQILLRSFKDDLDICPSVVIGQKIFGRCVNVGDKNKVTVLYGIPVLIFYLEFSILILMIDKIIAESFKGIVLININICIHTGFSNSSIFFLMPKYA